MKKTFYLLLLVFMISVLIIGTSVSVYAATSGQIGKCQWTLDGTVLSISGNGALKVDYENAPWGNSITELIINEGVTSISACAFADCDDLCKVALPSSLMVIDYGAFMNCTSLSSITIPNGVTTIGNYAFSTCSTLINITIPETVTHIGVEVFNQCYSLNNIFVDSSNSSYMSVSGVLYTKDKSVLIRYPSNKTGRKYTVPEEVKEISMGAFEDVWNLLDIKLHDGITKIGFNAFSSTVPFNDSSNYYDGCLYLGNHLIIAQNRDMTACTVRDGTKTVADGAFASRGNLQQVTLPEGLLYIGDSAFSWCSSLKSIYIPKSVKKIESSAFYDCNAIESVFYSGSTSERNKMMVEKYNEGLTDADWKYNSCHDGKEHDFKSGVITQNATCTAAGERNLICSVCDVVVTRKIDATGHNYGTWAQTKPPTCVSMGTEERSCTLCHDIESRTVPVVEHVYGPWTAEIKASCDDVGVEKRTCVICQNSEARNIEPRGHNYQKWSVDTAPTCTEDGLEKRICSNCDLFETRDLPATGHSYGEFETVKKPTFFENGTENAVCEKCGDVKTASLDKIDPKGYIICTCAVIAVALLAVVIVYIKKKKAVQ